MHMLDKLPGGKIYENLDGTLTNATYKASTEKVSRIKSPVH